MKATLDAVSVRLPMPAILYLSRGGQFNGSQRQLYYLLAGLDRRRYEPVVICPEEGSFLDLLRREGIERLHLT